jgi:outer membrane lipopolysaccharide assembly protein LptE/RlpB
VIEEVKSQKSKVKSRDGWKLARLFLSFSLFFFSVISSGCGYHLAGAVNLPQHIQRVSFAEIENNTLEVGIEKEFQWALEREFRTRGGLTIAEDGEGVFNIVVHRLDLRPLSFDQKDVVLEYEVAMVFDVSLTDRDSGQVLWQLAGLRVTSPYNAIPQVVVTSSPEFQRGTINSQDLRGFTEIQFSEAQRRTATERLFATAAREVYARLGDNF